MLYSLLLILKYGDPILGDIITKIDKNTISNFDDLMVTMEKYKTGDVVTIEFIRDSKVMTSQLTLAKGQKR